MADVSDGAGGRRALDAAKRLIEAEADLDVVEKALHTFVLDRQMWSDPPHEEVGRAVTMLARLKGLR